MQRLRNRPPSAGLLAYLKRLRDGADVGAGIVRQGWSVAYVYEKPFERLVTYQQAEAAAKTARRGVWSLCAGDFTRH